MYSNLKCKTKTNDVDEKGIVTVAVNGIGIEDAQGDISAKGSFNKTLKENFVRAKWFLNHDEKQLLGCPIEGREEDGNLVMVGAINLKKQIGAETLEDYKLFAEHGKTLEHSVGVKAIKRDEKNKAIVKEWFLGEYSTLTHWGANHQTFLMDIKSLSGNGLSQHIEMMRKALSGKYSDKRLRVLEDNLNIIQKAILGDGVVQCPYCGRSFDYNSQHELTFDSQVLEAAGEYAGWIARDIARQEMNKLKPEIQEQVLGIINQVKSLSDITSYVRCPGCYTRVYRSNVLIEPSEDTQQKQSRQGDTLDLKGLGDISVKIKKQEER